MEAGMTGTDLSRRQVELAGEGAGEGAGLIVVLARLGGRAINH